MLLLNSLKTKIESGETVLGTMLSEISTPNVARILSAAGFECLIIDCEHGYFDYSQTAAVIGICNGIRLPVIVRIPKIDRGCVTKYMDMGADGLLVPMTGTAEDIRRVVEYAKYAPLGRRGISTMRAHTNYNPPPLSQYTREANARTIVFAQIETREGVANSSAIAAVEGVDALLIGPNDLAMDLGAPGNFATPEMADCIGTVIASAKAAGKRSGIIASKIPFLQSCGDRGMTLFSCNSEVGMMMLGAKEIVGQFRQHT